MNNYENVKNMLKCEIQDRVLVIMKLQEEVDRLLKEIEEKKMQASEIEEAIKKLSE